MSTREDDAVTAVQRQRKSCLAALPRHGIHEYGALALNLLSSLWMCRKSVTCARTSRGRKT
eukprot:3220903-Pleurochrysis_carterae.AAC.1